MQSVFADVHPALDEQGSRLPFSGTWDISGYSYGDEQLATPAGVRYDLVLSNTGEGVLVEGALEAAIEGQCARCLDTVREQVSAEVEGYFLFEPAEEVEGMARDEFECVDDEGRVDLSGPLMGALVYGTPYVLLCSEDCPGLCPTCGERLADGACTCDGDAGDGDDDGYDEESPFAVLRGLDLG